MLSQKTKDQWSVLTNIWRTKIEHTLNFHPYVGVASFSLAQPTYQNKNFTCKIQWSVLIKGKNKHSDGYDASSHSNHEGTLD